MVTIIKENILKSLTHPELALTDLSAEARFSQLQNGSFCDIDYNCVEPQWGWFTHIKTLSELAGNSCVLPSIKLILFRLCKCF